MEQPENNFVTGPPEYFDSGAAPIRSETEFRKPWIRAGDSWAYKSKLIRGNSE